MSEFKRRIAAIQDAGLYRIRQINAGKTHVQRSIGGRKQVSFCGNDYLGLASDARVVKACQEGAQTYGVGSGASCLITGYTHAHQVLEEALAEFTQRESALLFSSGYLANLGIIQALVKPKEVVLADRLNHASLIDGARLAGARLHRYTHADSTPAQQLMNKHSCRLLASDAVFSMDGDLAPLPDLAALCEQHGILLLVDDAHGLGVLGERGRGTLAHYELKQNEVPILIGTLGKAFGTAGAFVAGSRDLIELLIQQARTYIYTTAQPAALACATLQSLKIIQSDPEPHQRLLENIHHFHRLAQNEGLPVPQTAQSAIFPIHTGDSASAVALSKALFEDGFMVSAIRPPTVPPNQARLRITLSSQHCKEDIERLVESLAYHYQAFATTGLPQQTK